MLERLRKLDREAVGDLVPVLPPLLRSIFSEVLVLPLFLLSPRVVCCTTSLEERSYLFLFCCCSWFIQQQGQPTSDPTAVALHIIQVEKKKKVHTVYIPEGRMQLS